MGVWAQKPRPARDEVQGVMSEVLDRILHGEMFLSARPGYSWETADGCRVSGRFCVRLSRHRPGQAAAVSAMGQTVGREGSLGRRHGHGGRGDDSTGMEAN